MKVTNHPKALHWTPTPLRVLPGHAGLLWIQTLGDSCQPHVVQSFSAGKEPHCLYSGEVIPSLFESSAPQYPLEHLLMCSDNKQYIE